MELMERYIRVGAHFWPDYTGGGTYHEQERRRIREELQGDRTGMYGVNGAVHQGRASFLARLYRWGHIP
ncbi:hypothetical protein XENTR_v10020568 [Xenopus tropicalis]|nr:hypothetical protein XENTR_v10020568 [Xenopus tropicalis]